MKKLEGTLCKESLQEIMTKELTGNEIKLLIDEKFQDLVVEIGEDNISLKNDKSKLLDFFKSLKDEKKFNLLSSVTSVDYMSKFVVVYHFTSIEKNESLVLKLPCGESRSEPSVVSVTSIWRGAELQEREIYDLMGIYFDNHPNMKRLLLWENFDGHPLRKDFVS
ncbi:MAG: NADH-quinone oxidoreductase subunit C [Chloroflexi bacterium]|nr:NADH-quinone oxidoreductase subunit C [Chloroflexota bacterium]